MHFSICLNNLTSENGTPTRIYADRCICITSVQKRFEISDLHFIARGCFTRDSKADERRGHIRGKPYRTCIGRQNDKTDTIRIKIFSTVYYAHKCSPPRAHVPSRPNAIPRGWLFRASDFLLT